MNTIKTEDKIEIKPGYKKTAIGIIPKDWEVDKIKRFTTKIGSGSTPRGGADVYIQNAIPFIRSQNVNNNILDVSDNVCIDLNTHIHMKSTTVYPEDVLLNITGASIGRSCVVPKSIIEANVNQHVCIIRLKKDINNIFIQSYLSSFKGQKEILRSQTGGNREGINHKSVKNLKLPIPPLPEQKAIADCLSTWDKGIEKLSALIASKKEQKKGLMQQLLTGKKRLDGFTEEWEEMRLGEILEESKIISEENDKSKRISVRLHLEGVHKRPVRGTEADSTTFYKRKSGQFIYGKQNFHNGSLGIIPEEFDGFETTSDLPSFNINNKVNHNWFFYYISRFDFYSKMESKTTGTGSKRLHPRELFSTKIPKLSIEEQTAIAEVLTTADKEIELLEQKLESYKTQKKGLMQVLLTGALRLCSGPTGWLRIKKI